MPTRDRSHARASARRASRQARERDIVDATRSLFDERGLQDAPIEDIARAVGINKALIYRHFSSKDELFVLTMTRYLADLAERVAAELDDDDTPALQLERSMAAYIDFCLEFPAFLDCALSLMRQPAEELRDRVSEAVWLRLGRGMGTLLGGLSSILARGAGSGDFAVTDPDFTANHIYAQTLGTMHLARSGVGVRVTATGIPDMFPLDPQDVRRAAVADALATVTQR
jgi:AcrR family transcriptional regulator